MAEAKGVPLQELLLGEPRVVEYLGRNLVARPSLLGAPAARLPPTTCPGTQRLFACLCGVRINAWHAATPWPARAAAAARGGRAWRARKGPETDASACILT